MLTYSEVRKNKVIMYEGEPWLVVDAHVFRKQQRKPVNATKLKNLVSGRMVETTFHVSDKVEEADMGKRTLKFVFRKKDELCFTDPKNPSNRMFLSPDLLGDQIKFLREGIETTASIFTNDNDEEQIIAIDLPIKMTFEVKEAPPSIKGDTATGGNKVVTLENDTTIDVPLFVSAGDKIVVNTETGEYVERAKE
ncbi:MAG: elongation factor P [Bacteroidetes bacterium]|nr:elongation factor P [Bacteroidota bacterium]